MSGGCDGDKPQFFDAALELCDGFLRLLHRHQRDAFQAARIGLAVAVEPGVVGMRDGAREIAILQKGQTQKYRGSEVDRGIDAFEIHVFKSSNRIEHARGFLWSSAIRRSADAEARTARLSPDFSFEQ